MYGCETWSLTLREERRLRVFENMVLRRIFGPKREEVTGEWRKLRNEKLNDLFSSPNISGDKMEKRWAGNIARTGERRGVYRVLVGKPEGKRQQSVDWRIILRRIFRKWDVGVWTGSRWLRIGPGGGALVNAVMNFLVP